jgi:hypothetical protein
VTLHMLKLCVGVDRIDELEDWIEEKIRKAKSKGKEPKLEHVTRQMPKRRDEILEGGSLFWVIKGFIQVRQPIVGLQARRGKDGIERCAIQFAPNLVQVQPSPRRAFQGWRYLEAKDAPADLGKRRKGEQELPPALLLELRQLGIL